MGPGDTLGPYEIEALIAEGGMGAVYRAKNRVTGQPRALKVVREELARNREFVDRFVREVTIASTLKHPNLVETLEPGIAGTTIYLPMELLVGETLAQRLRRLKRMSASDTAAILAPVCEAVQLLHDQKLVHRDLKPANIFIAKVGGRDVPKVIDLGTTRELEDVEHTMTGMVVGSPFYMAPEQAEGRRDVDGRADQYALGVVAYQMVTAARPYESDDTRSALAKLMRGDPYAPPSRVFAGLTPAVEAAIVRALSREREQRFARIVDFGRALAVAASGMDTAHTVADLSDAVEQAKALVAARPLLTVSGGAETQIRDITPTPSPMTAPSPMNAPTPTPSSAFAAPPPPTAAPSSSGGGGKLVAAIGVVALLAICAAVGVWVLSRRQVETRAVQLEPVGVPVTTAGTAHPPIVPLPVPSTVVYVPPTSVAVPPTSVAAPPTSVAAPPPATRVAPPTSVAVRPPPPSTRVAPPTTATRPPPTTTAGTDHPHRVRPPPGSAPLCGASTGIPCLE